MKKNNVKFNLLEQVFKHLSKDDPLYNNSNFILFIKTFLEDQPTNITINHDFVYMLTNSYNYINKNDLPKIRVFNLSDNNLMKNSTIIQSLSEDIKFLLDSIREYINENRYKTKIIVNPIFSAIRDEQGNLKLLETAKENKQQESFIHIEIDKVSDNKANEIEKNLKLILFAVKSATGDFTYTTSVLKKLIRHFKEGYLTTFKNHGFSLYESIHFLEWLLDDNFIFLGYRCYEFSQKNKKLYMQVNKSNAKGILSNYKDSACYNPVDVNDFPNIKKDRIMLLTPLLLEKSSKKSIIHRRNYMDLVEIREFTDLEVPLKYHRFLGLFTRKALFNQSKDIPILKTKLELLLEDKQIVKGSAMYREVLTVFNSLPKEELFFSSIKDLNSLIQLIVSAYRKQTIKIYLRRSILGTSLSIIMALPEKYFSSNNLNTVANYLKSFFNAKSIQYYQTRSHPGFWQAHYLVSLSDLELREFNKDDLEQEVTYIVKNWKDKLIDIIEKYHSNSIAESYYHKYISYFPKEYQSVYSPKTALDDIYYLEEYYKTNKNQYNIITPDKSSTPDKCYTTIRIYSNKKISLTIMMPILDNFGLNVIDELSYKLASENNDALYIHSFSVTDLDGVIVNKQISDTVLKEALIQVMDNNFENGTLNALITKTGMNYKQINLTRVYYNYYFQIERIFTRKTVAKTVLKYAYMLKKMFTFFDLKFNPKHNKHNNMKNIQNNILEDLQKVTDINEDRILKSFYNLIDSTLRTNYYSRDTTKNFLISIKIESQKVHNMPEPKPMYEIFVYSNIMEGIHLRGGKVARGGLRWSDRNDDYRTEILALMKTQMTKNAVIVPVGSKGGFVIKNSNQKQDPNFIKLQYQRFISAMLDITDNIIDNKIIHPKKVICYDNEDPYLVVAADKGTTYLSDAANEISYKYKYWMGDAFASGGSYGYDHKKEGITAKGAWECVKRHFREINKNVQEEEFSVIAIGDMSGDVFGNGMLLSKKILLKAAFNHIHIFIDPNPNAEDSYKERERLFNLPHSTWMDYNPNIISKGGGVFKRYDKSISITEEIKTLINTDENELSSEKLIKLILKANVELLWNGGIGTYIKSSSESNEQVRDKANDSLRINASELKVKVVGEGGNLGLTQLARVEYSLNDGRINTDSIDNSAGVDMSDHEVNLKILFSHLMDRKLVKNLDERNQFLSSLTVDLNYMVVKDNYLQSLAISMDHLKSKANIDQYRELIRDLIHERILDPKGEFIPTDKEIISYNSEGKGILRPQLSIIMAHEKMRAYQAILNSNIPDLPYCNKYIISYFPDKVYASFNGHITSHQLKREIIATTITNHIINSGGSTLLYELKRDTGHSYSNIAGAYLMIEDILDISEIRQAIYLLDNEIPAKLQYEKLSIVNKLSKKILSWNLAFKQCIIPNNEEIIKLKNDIWNFDEKLTQSITENKKSYFQKLNEEDIKKGIPSGLANKILALERLKSVFLYLPLSNKFNYSLVDCHSILTEIDSILSMDVVLTYLEQVSLSTIWDQVTYNYLSIQLQFVRYFLAKKILRYHKGSIEEYCKIKESQLNYYSSWVIRLKEGDRNISLHPITVILKYLWNIIN